MLFVMAEGRRALPGGRSVQQGRMKGRINVTPRECIVAALDHRVPARTPSFGWFHPEVRKTLLAYCETESWDEVFARLGIEGWVEQAPRLVFPDFEAVAVERPNGLPGRRAIWLDDRAYRDGWGVEYRIGERGWYQEWVGGPLVSAETISDVESCVLPGTPVENIIACFHTARDFDVSALGGRPG